MILLKPYFVIIYILITWLREYVHFGPENNTGFSQKDEKTEFKIGKVLLGGKNHGNNVAIIIRRAAAWHKKQRYNHAD